jgi:CSLREA domain-containing protein
MKRWNSFAALMLAAAFAAPAQANPIVVDTVADQYGSDTAHCSLREAVRAANTDAAYGGCTAGGGVDLIDLPDGVFVLTRAGRGEDAGATGDLDVAGDGVVVVGNGAAASIVDGNGLDRIFHVQAGAALLVLSNLTLRNGDPLGGSSADDVYGGAVYMDGSGAISMTGVHVSASRAAQGGGVFVDGGASAFGISGSSFSLNHATDYGGAVLSRRELNATNSTFSGNSTGCVGSAIYFSDVDVEHTLASVTVADNHGSTRSNCTDAPALWNAFSSSATVRVRNSIVARNYSGFVEVNCDEITSDDYNLIGSTEDCDLLGTLTNTLTGVDPQLMPLFDYGNGTPSHMILPGSPAIGAGNPAAPGSGGNACPSADQRGVDRSDCDVGAYEYRPTFTVSRQDDAADATPGNGQCDAVGGGCTLRAAIAEANERDEPTTVVLPAGTFRLTLPNVPNQDSGDLELEPAAALAVVGAGAGRSVVLGDGHDDQIFQLFSGANALLRLSVRGGTEHAQVSAGGVAVLNDPALLADVEIADNQGCFGGLHVRDHVIAERVSIHDNLAEVAGGCPYNGGGVYVGSGGVLEMRNGTVSGNRAKEGGGGIFVEGGTARLVHVTVANNVADYAGGGTQGGGGLGRGSSGTVFLKNSIVAGNASGSGVGPDCAALVQSQDFNLIGNAAGCTLGGSAGHDLVGADPHLAPLGLYGGLLPVHPPRPDSPAVDGVGVGQIFDRQMACRDGSLRSVSTDQRGAARPEGDFCDIGAFEGSADSIFADGFD